MRKHFFRAAIILSTLFTTARYYSQCTFSTQYGSAVINNTNPGTSVTITTCQFGGEYAPITFNVTGAFTFSSSVISDYLTLTNASNSVIANGFTPLNAVIPTTGTYYLHTSASGPPACLTQNSCRTTRVVVPFPPCTGVPLTGTVSAIPSVVCPNTSATLSLPGSSTGSGLMYQWYYSTLGPFGPFSLLAGAGSATVTTPPTASVTTWYQAVMVCTNSAQNATSAPVSVGIAGTTTNSIPYSEGFENLIVDNQLPNCSWKASNLPITCQTYIAANTNNRVPRSGSKFASFYYTPAANSYFYTNGLLLHPGITYSASVWFTTEYYTYSTWTDLSLMLGPNQSTLGLQTIASTNGVAASPNYKSLSNTFTVASSGIYYLGIKASSFGPCCAQYLSFDDIEVTAPCSINTPTALLNTSANTICNGQNVVLTAIGASSYTWSTGANTATIVTTPTSNTVISVMFSNPNNPCTNTLNQAITVLQPSPISIYPSTLLTCPGNSVVLLALGANSYTWSQGGNGNTIAVTPSVNTTYSVIGTNILGCNSQAAVSVSILPVPSVSATSSKSIACVGETITLTGLGAQTYTWFAGNNVYFGSQVLVTPEASSLITVSGTGPNGCSNSYLMTLNVEECLSVSESSGISSGTEIYPNPGSGHYTVRLSGSGKKVVEVFDAVGKCVLQFVSERNEVNFDLGSECAKGIYYLKIQTEAGTQGFKLIKQ